VKAAEDTNHPAFLIEIEMIAKICAKIMGKRCVDEVPSPSHLLSR